MNDIQRSGFTKRIHMVVVHNGTAYLTGQVGTPGKPVAEQMQEVLDKVDSLLAQAGTDKTRILHCNLWLDDLRDYDAVNQVWDQWVPMEEAPARSTGQCRLARPGMLVELSVIAAV